MKKYKIKDLMVPLSNYAVIPEDATIFEAVMALEKTQLKFNQNSYLNRAILIEDSDGPKTCRRPAGRGGWAHGLRLSP